jgi:hypothetical protein
MNNVQWRRVSLAIVLSVLNAHLGIHLYLDNVNSSKKTNSRRVQTKTVKDAHLSTEPRFAKDVNQDITSEAEVVQ